MTGEAPGRVAAAWPLLVAAVVAVAFTGFISGTRPPRAPLRAGGAALVPARATDNMMPKYGAMGAELRGPNAGLYSQAFATLGNAVPPRDAPVDPPTAEARAQAVAARAERRTHDGAPPRIPHAIDQQGQPSCLACHLRGAVVAGRTARAMSHESYTSCVQCHVVTRDPRPPRSTTSDEATNLFTGLASPGAGPRAAPIAPPRMPHSTWMRQRCDSCHGPAGDPGLRTTHPERQSCNQCHPPQAEMERRFPMEALR